METEHFDFAELFTLCVRQAVPLAASKQQSFGFDYRGPRVMLQGDATAMKRGIYRLLCGAVDLLETGFVVFTGSGRPHGHGTCEVTVTAAGTGLLEPDACIGEVLERLQLTEVRVDAGSRAAGARSARGVCPVTQAAVSFASLPAEGVLFSLAAVLPGVVDTSPLPDAGGARAWAVNPNAVAAEALLRRLERLGWTTEAFGSCVEVEQRLRSLQDKPGLPSLLVVMETPDVTRDALRSVAALLPPSTTLVLAVIVGSPSLLNLTPVEGFQVRALPLGPTDLYDLTRRLDGLSPAPPRLPGNVPEVQRPRALIVDDNEVNRIVAAGMLEVLGCQAVTAHDGAEAIEQCRHSPPDVVLMDLDMPRIDGVQCTAALRALQRRGEVPPFSIIAVTADATPAARVRSITAGTDAYLSKPLDLQVLGSELRRRLLPLRSVRGPDLQMAPDSEAAVLQSLFPGGGEMAGRMRAVDWARSELGPVSTWPSGLRAALGLCLTSQFPMQVWWGPRLTLFYNDAYIPLLGPQKHPAALARPGREAWPEVWDTLGPMIEQVMRSGEANWAEDLLMFFDRRVAHEEVYVTFSFSPVFGDGRQVDGIFGVCTETTEKLVGNRRLETLRRLGLRSGEPPTVEQACRQAAAMLSENPHDIPFAAIYLADADARQADLVASAGLPDGHPLPVQPRLTEDETDGWPLAAALRLQRVQLLQDLPARGVKLTGRPWPEPCTQALVMPIAGTAPARPAGLLVVGVGPRRPLDAAYRAFFDLVAGQIASALGEATVYAAERRRAEALAELDRAKTAFYSSVSHEFRTPLTLMLAPLEDALAMLPSSDQQALAPLLETAHANATRLLRLVNALLDLSRLEAHRVQGRFEPTDLRQLSQDLAEVFRPAIERARLRLVLHCEALPQLVYLDPALWEKVVFNLLSNAVKFTFEGEIEVSVRDDGGQAVFAVRDTGIGVPEAELPHLFERFHRVEGAPSRTDEGSGIGLAVVQALVQLHGGEIHVSSTPGGGTTFTIALRYGSAHLPPERVLSRPETAATRALASAYLEEALRWTRRGEVQGAPSGPPAVAEHDETRDARILVVDDNVDIRDYLVRLLSRRWQVEAAGDGEQALAILRRRSFDLVLSDVRMPRLDGLGLLRAMRADPSLQAIPVIMISGRAGEESRLEGLEGGADDYLIKPFSAREVVARVAAQIKLARRQALVESNRAKDEFIAMLSHELRNPLSPIMTAVQLLWRRDGPSDELALIQRQAERMARLIDDLLDVSRIAHGKVELNTEVVELAVIVQKGVETVQPRLQQQRQHLEVEVPSEGLKVRGDVGRLAQVVANLLGNAAKFSQPGSRICISAAAVEGRVRLRVQDEGMGIAPELLGSLFERFVQLPQALDRRKSGLGLGLAIVRGLVELHGGTVRVHSKGEREGAEFIVELPLADSAVPELPLASPRTPAGELHGRAELPRVLVVDDNEDYAETLARLFRLLGCEVETAYDGPSALEVAHRFRPLVCLLDIGLPRMDGYEVARRLRQSEGNAGHMRIVAVTGYGQESDRLRSASAGFDAHLVKPVNVDMLASAVLH
ncbi:response regulator [Caldimonas brevitalea]|uniref:histidine kinase n=1 Tax=Caldimonas brevitalea TaxID=413882 RepID=A0A0G3BNR1_9BURK|nr:response regulator [Caldimonas brevitalea]AKJ29628.1 chemotaxis protein methyltransferase CheR [Caldimonas brevitalea]